MNDLDVFINMYLIPALFDNFTDGDDRKTIDRCIEEAEKEYKEMEQNKGKSND